MALLTTLISGWVRRALWQATVGMTAIGGGAGEVVDIIDLRDVPPAPVVVDLRDQLPTDGERPLRKSVPTTLVIHHTATNGSGWGTIAELHVWANGWKAIGYAFGTSWDGRRFLLHDPERVQVHAKDHNSTTIGLAMLGNFHTRELSDLQAQVTKDYARELAAFYGYRYIRPHRDIRATACPGKYAMQKLDDLWIRP